MRSALHKAAASNDVAAARELLSAESADVNGLDEGLTPLVVAAAQGANGVLDLLLADPRCQKDMPSYEDMTALHIACGGINVETVAKLVLAGCDVNAKDLNGNTPPMIAAEQMMISQHHHATSLRIMLDSGRVEVNGTNNDGATLLHMAAYKGRLDMCELLVSKGWDTNALDGHGHTALHHSVAAWNLKGDPIVAKYLISIGVDPLVKNADGETAEDVAAQNEHPKGVEYLKSVVAEAAAKKQ